LDEVITNAKALLQDPALFDRITQDEFDKTIVGEFPARKAIFLSLCSIYVNRRGHPHTSGNVIVNSTSSAGKSYITKNICEIFPEERWIYRTSITPQVLTYWHNPKWEPEWTWDGKILYLEDVRQDVLLSPSLKVMTSEGSQATVIIKQRPIDIPIAGKPCVIMTTAKAKIPEEITNRFSLVSLNETEQQTRAVIDKQAEWLEKNNKEKYALDVKKAMDILGAAIVDIPYAQKLAKHFPANQIRIRRDFTRLIGLIENVAALYQCQREATETGHIIANGQDYEIAKDILDQYTNTDIMGLSRSQKRYWESICQLNDSHNAQTSLSQDEEEWRFTAKEVWANDPTQSQPSWYEMLDLFCEKQLLNVKLERKEDSDKRVATYGLNSITSELSLPDVI
jgi:hypothetical protein